MPGKNWTLANIGIWNPDLLSKRRFYELTKLSSDFEAYLL